VGALKEMVVEGVSTRKVTDVTEASCATTFSRSTVSRLMGGLDADLKARRELPLTAAYPYSFVDARYEYVRVSGQVVSQGALVVKGVRDDGRRELLAVPVAGTESEATYEDLFRRLKDRGVRGVRLVTSDDQRGQVNAVRKHFQGVAWQRCQVHVARNALGKVGRWHQRAISADVRAVFNAHACVGTSAQGRGRRPQGALAPAGCRVARDRLGGRAGVLRVPRGASAPDPQHQRPGALRSRARAPHVGGAISWLRRSTPACGW